MKQLQALRNDGNVRLILNRPDASDVGHKTLLTCGGNQFKLN